MSAEEGVQQLADGGEVEVGAELGRGSGAVVREGAWRGKPVAVKVCGTTLPLPLPLSLPLSLRLTPNPNPNSYNPNLKTLTPTLTLTTDP